MFLHKIIVFLSDLEFLLSQDKIKKSSLKTFLAYTKIRIKASLNRWFHFKSENFLGYQVKIIDYDIFLSIFRQIFVRNTYFFKTDKINPSIIDCGGNIGMSVLYFKYLYPDATITVFEPSLEVIDILRENIKNNNLKNVEIINAAVSDKYGEGMIFPRGSAACGNTLESNLLKNNKKQNNRAYRIKKVLLSSYIKRQIDLLKLDIEGSEGSVINELAKTSKIKMIDVYVMEYHYYPLVKDNSLSDIIKTFEKFDLGVQIYFEDVPMANSQFDLYQNGSYSLSLRTSPLNLKDCPSNFY